jgi:type IV pilus assembly protein PilY1
VVEKGGHAYRLRSGTTRNVQTCSPVFASCTALTSFNTANGAITQALLGAASAAERDALINWQRGLDLDDEDLDGVTSAEMRPSAHGDVLHSRPVVLNYGPEGDPDFVVFYGGNDGVLRAVNGNQADAIGSVAAGGELWSFVVPEFYGAIKRLRDNNVPMLFEGSPPPPPDRARKSYGVDGPITGYRAEGSTWINAAMRRGGRFVMSFDVSNIVSVPGSVALKWKLGCPNLTNDTDCSSGLSGIGQTWSAPRVIKTNGYASGGVPRPMLIMGGGYDACEDADPNSCDATAKGRAIYVLDADDGSLLRTFVTDRPVAADVFIVPDGTTGLAKFAYAADTGGNLYRISGSTAHEPFDATAPADWTMTKIASLGCDSTATCTGNRKFLFAPDVVEKNGIYHLLIGSGDREKPLQAFDTAYAVENHFFMIKDSPTDTEWLSDESANCGGAIICLASLVQIPSGADDPDPADLAAAKGWYLEMRDHEQVVTTAITVFGATTFSTHTPTVPEAGSCSANLGTARVYNVKFSNAAAAFAPNNRDSEIAGGGLPPSPVAGLVQLDDGTTVPFIIGAVGDSPLEALLPTPPTTGTQPKSMTYWLTEK